MNVVHSVTRHYIMFKLRFYFVVCVLRLQCIFTFIMLKRGIEREKETSCTLAFRYINSLQLMSVHSLSIFLQGHDGHIFGW